MGFEYKILSELLDVKCFGEYIYDGNYTDAKAERTSFEENLNSLVSSGWEIVEFKNAASAARSGGSGAVHMNWLTVILRKAKA